MLADKIAFEIEREPGVTDRRLAELIFGSSARSTQINGECHFMQGNNRLVRKKRSDGLIGNYPIRAKPNLRLI